jgi:hypothetical protein
MQERDEEEASSPRRKGSSYTPSQADWDLPGRIIRPEPDYSPPVKLGSHQDNLASPDANPCIVDEYLDGYFIPMSQILHRDRIIRLEN